jgi:sterol desaturase/sphingolipid hydroxylase (fatty acid hydroxylase superfamily)
MYAVRTFMLAELGFYAYHRLLGHGAASRLHHTHHSGGGESTRTFRSDELRGCAAMVAAHLMGPFKINAAVYYSYLLFLLGVHRVSHWDEAPRLLRYHHRYHNEHHRDPSVNFAIVTPLMDVLFGTCAPRQKGSSISG